ncbi:MAG: glutamine synthetase [Clostridia bacterium]|jgi:glutamine synthetase|nr:glutamine synthetase [Clostridia bacterium]MCI9290812.1 glutamine synthetase [Clostridia bacterium]
MSQTVKEVLDFVKDNDVKFVKLTFCDSFGNIKNISIIADELPTAFEKGVSFEAYSVGGFVDPEESDLLLYPDASTIQLLPWRPQHGSVVRFFCKIRRTDGRDFDGDGRGLLATAQAKLAGMGLSCLIGSDCEFYLFKTDESGEPTLEPHDKAGYLDVAPFDKGENVRRDICLTMERMGVKPLSSHHERGPGQNEICFKGNDALMAADDLLTFKTVVKAVANMNGLHASFMPKPLKDEIGSGLHITLSLLKDGDNLFEPSHLTSSKEAEGFVAGILARAKEMAVFLNPTINSYERLENNEEIEAYNKIAWSYLNGRQLIRIKRDGLAKMQLRSADPSCNPYIAYALLLFAGAEGIEKGLKLSKEADINSLNEVDSLPEDLMSAIEAAKNSEFIARYIPKGTLDKFFKYKQDEYGQYSLSKDKDSFVTKTYFKKI